jgi:hypothetical protein
LAPSVEKGEVRRRVLPAILGIGLGFALAAFAASREAHGQPVPPLLAIVLVAWAVTNPLLIVVHELGHAVVALKLTEQRVLVQSGPEDSLLRFALGRIDFRIDPRHGRAYCEVNPSGLTPPQWLAMCAAGPTAAFAAGIGAAALSARTADSSLLHWELLFAALLATMDFLVNLIPLAPTDTRPLASDGWHIKAMLKLRGTPAWRQPMRERPARATLVLPRADQFSRIGLGVLEVAFAEAKRRDSQKMTTADLLLGLTTAEATTGILCSAMVSRDAIRSLPPEASRELDEGSPPQISAHVIASVRGAGNALGLTGVGGLGPEHLLYALLREPDTDAKRIIERLGGDLDTLAASARSLLLATGA